MALFPATSGKSRKSSIYPGIMAGIIAFAVGGVTGCDKQNGTDKPTAPTASAPPPELVLNGVDTATLTAREKGELRTLVTELMSPCADVPVPVAQCVNEKRSCRKCLPAANFLMKGVRKGIARDDIQKVYKARFDPSMVKELPIDGSPVMGPEKAPVTITEFADFECPGCRAMMPVVDKLMKAYEGKVKLVYKIVVLNFHAHARVAAEAALAAREQGKFWEMHHQIFENQDALDNRDLERYAKTAGLDVTKFRNEFKLDRVASQIERDAKLAEKVAVVGTPTLFINGHQFMPLVADDSEAELSDAIQNELPTDGAAAAPSASASAGAPAPSGKPAGKGK